jgi:hypothetical protein
MPRVVRSSWLLEPRRVPCFDGSGIVTISLVAMYTKNWEEKMDRGVIGNEQNFTGTKK